MKLQLLSAFLFLAVFATSAAELDTKGRDPKYVENIVERSKKIVDNIEAVDKQAAVKVTNIIANRYFKLNDIYERRDSLVKAAKADPHLSFDARNAAIANAQNEKDAAIYKTYFGFLSELSIYCSDSQMNAVKDGMTFGVLMVTYNSTLDMIPSLKDEEKKQIMAWLVEAREYAVNAESSHKKHEAFGKYKGRINNYLSARGYNLVKEREAWYKRIKEREAAAKK
jgi:hypothetical protein